MIIVYSETCIELNKTKNLSKLEHRQCLQTTVCFDWFRFQLTTKSFYYNP